VFDKLSVFVTEDIRLLSFCKETGQIEGIWNIIEPFCCLYFFQLARIQTDSVVEKLKGLHPDVHFEIGRRLLCNIQNIVPSMTKVNIHSAKTYFHFIFFILF